MIVFNPNETSHVIKIIPRFYSESAITLNLRNEETDNGLTYELQPVISDGYMYISFTQEFADNSNYQVTVVQDEEVAYKGKMFITNQSADLQNYKISKDVFQL